MPKKEEEEKRRASVSCRLLLLLSPFVGGGVKGCVTEQDLRIQTTMELLGVCQGKAPLLFSLTIKIRTSFFEPKAFSLSNRVEIDSPMVAVSCSF